MNLGDKVCLKCGSKVAEMSHPSARVSTPEDKRINVLRPLHLRSHYAPINVMPEGGGDHGIGWGL